MMWYLHNIIFIFFLHIPTIAEADITCLETGLKYGLDKNKERLDKQWRTGTVIGKLECNRIFINF